MRHWNLQWLISCRSCITFVIEHINKLSTLFKFLKNLLRSGSVNNREHSNYLVIARHCKHGDCICLLLRRKRSSFDRLIKRLLFLGGINSSRNGLSNCGLLSHKLYLINSLPLIQQGVIVYTLLETSASPSSKASLDVLIEELFTWLRVAPNDTIACASSTDTGHEIISQESFRVRARSVAFQIQFFLARLGVLFIDFFERIAYLARFDNAFLAKIESSRCCHLRTLVVLLHIRDNAPLNIHLLVVALRCDLRIPCQCAVHEPF